MAPAARWPERPRSRRLRGLLLAPLWLAGILGAAAPAGAAPPAPAAGLRFGSSSPLVVIDPGHGGANRGALGPDGVEEKRITLAVAQRLRAILEDQTEYGLILSHEQDLHISLRERAEVANLLGADLLLSIHCNSSPRPGPRGYESFYLSTGGLQDPAHPDLIHAPLPSQELPEDAAGGPQALAILGDLEARARHERSALLALHLVEAMATRLRGPDRGVRQAPFDVLIHARVPAVVVELGFLNHPQEGRLLLDPAHQELAAQALATGVRRYLDDPRRDALETGGAPPPAPRP